MWRARLAPEAVSVPLWYAYSRARQWTDDRGSSWIWWETSLDSERTGVLSFASFLEQAFVARAAEVGARAFPRTDVMLGDGQFLADEKYLFQRFRELLLGDEVLRAEPGRAGSALDVLLRQLYDKAESNEQESIIHAPVDQARIESFKDALLGAWTAEGTLRLLLEQVKWGPAISVSAAQNNEPDP